MQRQGPRAALVLRAAVAESSRPAAPAGLPAFSVEVRLAAAAAAAAVALAVGTYSQHRTGTFPYGRYVRLWGVTIFFIFEKDQKIKYLN